MKAWVDTYTPKDSSEIVGREKEISLVKEYLAGKSKKPLLIAGPPGAGKTSLVYALAKDFEIIEANASDSRNKKSIEETIGQALKQQSLFMKPRLVLVDEVDGVSGMKDRGGNLALSRLLKETKTPAIMTANEPDSDKLKPLRKIATLIILDPLSTTQVVERLNSILKKEGLSLDEKVVSGIARRTGGDLRAAINDLQTVASTKEKDLSVLGDRDHTSQVEESLLRVFKTTNLGVAMSAYDDLPMPPDQVMMWIDENLPREYRNEDLARAFESVSKADVFLGRIRKQQHYRYYVYMNALLSGGVALAKKEKYPGQIEYKRSERPLKMWIAKNANAKRKAIAEKIAAATHSSLNDVLQEFPLYLRAARNREFLASFVQEFDLDSEQVAWMKQKVM